MRYQNLDLQIERDASGAYVIQGKSRQGDFRDQASIDLDGLATRPDDPGGLKAWGGRLFEFLFRTRTEAKLATLLDRSLGAASQAGEGLRIRLMLDEANPAVAATPWEYCYRSIDDRFLASHGETPLVRFIEVGVPLRKTEAKLPLSMLVVIPAVDGLNVELEVSLLEEALSAMPGAVTHQVLDGYVTPERLRETLETREWDVLHFIGHGDFDGERATLRFNDESGRALAVDQDAMAALVRNEQSLKLVVLNSCQGAQVSATRAFVGMAPKLVGAGVPAVVAMQYPIAEKEALAFVKAFYHGLFESDGRGSIDFAICSARAALSLNCPGAAFGVPAAFVRYDEGILFKVLTGNTLRDALMSRSEAAKQRATIAELQGNHARVMASVRATDPEVQARLVSQQGELDRAKRRLRLRTASLIATAGAALVAFLAFAIGLLGKLPLTWFVAASPVWFGDPVGAALEVDSIVLVTIDRPIDPGWRPRHAAVVDKLSEAGAPVVVLDIAFENPSPGDSALVSAFERARARGTAVIFGAAGLDGSRPKAVPALAEAATVAGVCLGANRSLFSGVVPLVWVGGTGDSTDVVLPSVALATVAAWRRTEAVVDLEQPGVTLVDRTRRVVDRVDPNRVVEVAPGEPNAAGCAMASQGGRYAELLTTKAPLVRWRDPVRHRDYAAVEASRPEELGWARGRIVMVGSYTEGDLFEVRSVLSSEKRYGVERHADAIATILAGAEIRPLGWWASLGLITVAALAGAWIAGRGDRRIVRAIPWLLGAILGFGLIATLGYRMSRTLVDIIYPTVALLLAFLVVSRLRRRWLA